MVTTRSSSVKPEVIKQDFKDVPASAEDDAEIPRESYTWQYWVALIFPVGFVYIIPFVFIGVSLLHIFRFGQLRRLPSQHWTYSVLLWTGYSEIVFQTWFNYLCIKAQKRKQYEPKSNDFLRKLLWECMGIGIPVDHIDGRRPAQQSEPDWSRVPPETLHALRRRLRVWFLNAPFSAAKADNVREWLAWAIGNGQTLEEAVRDPESAKLIEECLAVTQNRLRWHFPPGYNPDVKTMRLTIDPVKLAPRPLGYYVVTNLFMGLPAYLWLIFYHGFRVQSRHGLQLLVKAPSEGSSPIEHPVVLLHALGVGVAHNRAFLKHVAQSKRGVVLLLQPNISTHIWHPRFLDPPSPTEHALAVKEACDSVGIKQATVISQSNGTMVHGWLLRNCKELCFRNILVDAVSFKLFEGTLCYAFLHKQRHTALHLILNYFVLRELGIAHSISRDFQWPDMSLWEWELPSVQPDRCRIVLGESDSLIDTQSIVTYLHECGVPDETVRVIPGGHHGVSLIMESPGMNEVLKMLRPQEGETRRSAGELATVF